MVGRFGINRYGGKGEWPDFGPGAAVHLSSNPDPVQQWLKQVSVVEKRSFEVPDGLAAALRQSAVTAGVINDNLGVGAETFCHRSKVHVSTLKADLRTMVELSLPRPLTAM